MEKYEAKCKRQNNSLCSMEAGLTQLGFLGLLRGLDTATAYANAQASGKADDLLIEPQRLRRLLRGLEKRIVDGASLPVEQEKKSREHRAKELPQLTYGRKRKEWEQCRPT